MSFFIKAPISVKLSGIFLLVLAAFALFPGFFAPDALAQNVLTGTLPPFSAGHPLGTDSLGRDALKLLIAGSRSALVGPLVIAAGSSILGLILGGLAAWRGGAVDYIISRYADITLSMPTLLLAIVAAGIIGGGYWVSVLVMLILYSPFDIRLARSAVHSQKSKPYIEAALVLRLSSFRILAKHIFPNIAPVMFANFFLNIAYGIVSMSSLSFLGLGVSPGDADWGRQLADGRALLFDNPASALGAGGFIVLAALAINIVGSYASEDNTL